jgi:hypothetical protein
MKAFLLLEILYNTVWSWLKNLGSLSQSEKIFLNRKVQITLFTPPPKQ